MKISRDWFYFGILCVLWLMFPVLSIIPLIYVSFSYRFGQNRILQNIVIFIVGITYGLIGLTVESSVENNIPTDLERYKDVYDYLVSTTFAFEYISGNFVFDTINWCCAHYITTNSQFVAFIWPCISIICLLLAVKNIMIQYIENNGDKYAMFIFATLLMIPFAVLYELLKQITAFSVIVYALSLPHDYNRNKKQLLLFVLAFFIHYASVLLLFPLILAKFKVFKNDCWIYLILFVSLLLSQVNILNLVGSLPIVNLLSLADKVSAYSDFSDFGGSKRFYIGVCIYFILTILYLKDRRRKECYPFFLFFITLLLNFSNNHNLARLINTMSPFLIIFFIISSRLLKMGWSRAVYIASFVMLIFMFNFTQYISNVNNKYYYTFYDNNIVKLLTSNCLDLVAYNEE